MAHLLKGCDPKLSFIPLPGRLPFGEKERGMVGARDGYDFLLPLRDILMILKLQMKNHCTLSPLFSDAYNSKEYKWVHIYNPNMAGFLENDVLWNVVLLSSLWYESHNIIA